MKVGLVPPPPPVSRRRIRKRSHQATRRRRLLLLRQRSKIQPSKGLTDDASLGRQITKIKTAPIRLLIFPRHYCPRRLICRHQPKRANAVFGRVNDAVKWVVGTAPNVKGLRVALDKVFASTLWPMADPFKHLPPALALEDNYTHTYAGVCVCGQY
jgi:hypothetical protein